MTIRLNPHLGRQENSAENERECVSADLRLFTFISGAFKRARHASLLPS